MTLIVSLRTVDGIVLAGDSLATYMTSPQVKGDIDVTCPSCGHQHTTEASLWGNALPARTLSYAQKVFPFFGSYGVGTYGAGQLNRKTIYFALRELERNAGAFPNNLLEAAQAVGDEMLRLLSDELTGKGFKLEDFADSWQYVGAQVVGYENSEPVTYEVGVGKAVDIVRYDGLDVTPSGVDEVFGALYEIYKANTDSIPLIDKFALQDAIEYAEFLIKTTSLHQQFSRKIPSVGGDIDIAVITPFDQFRWVKQKPLYAKLNPEEL